MSQVSNIEKSKYRFYDNSTLSCTDIDFNGSAFQKDTGGIGPASALCEKKKWAEECGVNWDGITSNDNICYSTIN